MPHKREIAPRKERHAFLFLLFAALLIAVAGVIVVRHTLHTQHPPVAMQAPSYGAGTPGR